VRLTVKRKKTIVQENINSAGTEGKVTEKKGFTKKNRREIVLEELEAEHGDNWAADLRKKKEKLLLKGAFLQGETATGHLVEEIKKTLRLLYRGTTKRAGRGRHDLGMLACVKIKKCQQKKKEKSLRQGLCTLEGESGDNR